MWDQASGEQKVTGGRNVVSGFVPKIRKLQQRHMQQEDATKDNGEYQRRWGPEDRMGEIILWVGRLIVETLLATSQSPRP